MDLRPHQRSSSRFFACLLFAVAVLGLAEVAICVEQLGELKAALRCVQ
jgi:hypothetical protein